MIKHFLLLLLLTSLYACSGAEDNSEPPAELVDFESSIEIEELWSVSIGGGDQQQYLKLYPLMLEDRLIVADRNGEVLAVNLKNGNKIWQVNLDVILSGGVGGNEQSLFVTTRDGEIISLNAEGKVNWRERISSEVLVPPVLIDEVVIIKSLDGQVSGLDIRQES